MNALYWSRRVPVRCARKRGCTNACSRSASTCDFPLIWGVKSRSGRDRCPWERQAQLTCPGKKNRSNHRDGGSNLQDLRSKGHIGAGEKDTESFGNILQHNHERMASSCWTICIITSPEKGGQYCREGAVRGCPGISDSAEHSVLACVCISLRAILLMFPAVNPLLGELQ